MQKSNSIIFFKDEYDKFSNFYPVIIYYEDREYPSIEHAYVASKSKDELFRKRIAELPPEDAGKAKSLGRKIKLRPNFDLMKVPLMQKFVIQKFRYDKFKRLLLMTGSAYIEEGNYWHDNFWGNCYCKKCEDIEGKNKLGKLIMKDRNLIKLGG